MVDETAAQTGPQAEPQTADTSPVVMLMSEGEAQGVAALQHLAAWLAAEEARLAHELAYVREAAQHARAGLHTHLARTFGVDVAHTSGVAIDLDARTISVPPSPAAPSQALGQEHERE